MTAHAPAAIGVTVDRVSKRFTHQVKGEVYAARDVSIDVKPGEFLTLLGPSGCGKTTTLRMVAGFEMPDAGRIAFAGQDVTRMPANQRGIGFVFQNYALFPHLSVAENVAYGLRVRGVRKMAVIDEKVEQALRGAALWDEVKDRLQDLAFNLSGGQQQRLCIARALATDPEILLFDEPTSALDPIATANIEELIADLKSKLTILIVTHNMQQAARVSDYTAYMYLGEMIEFDATDTIFLKPKNKATEDYITGRFG
jgi:phosphate transport system ATP-binding protein